MNIYEQDQKMREIYAAARRRREEEEAQRLLEEEMASEPQQIGSAGSRGEGPGYIKSMMEAQEPLPTPTTEEKKNWLQTFLSPNEATRRAQGEVVPETPSWWEPNEATMAAQPIPLDPSIGKGTVLRSEEEEAAEEAPAAAPSAPAKTDKAMATQAAKQVQQTTGAKITPTEKKKIEAEVPGKASDVNKWLYLIEAFTKIAGADTAGRGAKLDLSALKEMRAQNVLTDRQTTQDKTRADERRDAEEWKQKNFEQRQQQIQATRGARQDARQEKKDEKKEALRVGDFGYARTSDDAKKLKSAMETKESFDSSLGELIALREKHGGGAILNRDDVARGKQLSKQLLLQYKDMAKLGVLSASDEAILNAIIPSDPLAYDWVPGGDPILHKLKKFHGDVQRDYQTKLKNRLQDYQGPASQGATPQGKKPAWAK